MLLLLGCIHSLTVYKHDELVVDRSVVVVVTSWPALHPTAAVDKRSAGRGGGADAQQDLNGRFNRVSDVVRRRRGRGPTE